MCANQLPARPHSLARTAAIGLTTLSIAAAGHAGMLIFPGFKDTSLLTLNNAAAVVETADGFVLRVTPAIGNRAGSVFSSETVDATSFSTKFAFRFTGQGGAIFDCNTTNGADGLVFVVQSVSSAIGGAGGGIGYAGIPRSVGVEFDSWCNAANNDPNSSHVGILLNGSVNHGAGAPFTAPVVPDLDAGDLWWAWVDYDGTTMRVYLSRQPVQPFQPILSRDLDLPAILQQDTGFVGFTSGTGSAWANHDVVYWEYTLYSPVCIGDFDGDGIVGGADLALMLASWGSDLAMFDLSGDTVIDGQDVAVLLSNWGPCPTG
jgi:hypothetical protein